MQSVIEKFRPILKKALNDYINELMSDKIKSALDVNIADKQPENVQEETTEDQKEKISRIVTTNEELEAYFVIKNLLKEYCAMEDIVFKDTESYFRHTLSGKNNKNGL